MINEESTVLCLKTRYNDNIARTMVRLWHYIRQNSLGKLGEDYLRKCSLQLKYYCFS